MASKVTHALAGVAGVAIGFMVMALVYTKTIFRTCENEAREGFECSW